MYLVQIGYISINSREDIAVRMARIPHYVEIYTGTPVQPHELARFQARHSFTPQAQAETQAA
jgi:hypothetical protein